MLGCRVRKAALALGLAALLASMGLAAGCKNGDSPGYKHDGGELWHDVGYETTRAV